MPRGAFDPALFRLLKAAGCEIVRRAKGSHTLWQSPFSRARFAVPQHVKNKGIANRILKQAGIAARL